MRVHSIILLAGKNISNLISPFKMKINRMSSQVRLVAPNKSEVQ